MGGKQLLIGVMAVVVAIAGFLDLKYQGALYKRLPAKWRQQIDARLQS